MFPKVGLASHLQPCIKRSAQIYAIVYFLQISEIWDMSWMHLVCVWLWMVMSAIHTCHNKLNCTFNLPWRAFPHFTSKFGIVSSADVLDNQGSSSFNFNSSFVRWRNWRMFLQTMTVVKNHYFKFTIYQNTEGNGCNFIMWISIVPHQVGITTFVKVAWIRRFLGEYQIHTH